MAHRGCTRIGACLAACLALALTSGAAQAAENIVVIGLEVDDAAFGNGDGSLEPGETANLKVELYNDGTSNAAVTGELLLTEPLPGVALLDAFASWQTLFPRNFPRFSDAPHFQVRLDGFMACGRVIPFALRLTSPSGTRTVPLPLRIGRRVDHDARPVPARSFSRPETTLFGPNAGDALGASVASGDFNGDGYADLVVAAPNADSWLDTRPDAGEVSILYGSPDRRPDVDLLPANPAIPVFYGANGSDRLGSRLASGDIDGDGFDDLLLAAAGGDGPGDTRLDAGEVYLIYGQASSWGAVDLAAAPPQVARIWGADPEDGDDNQDSGAVEVATGDLNGDGFDDILLGFDTAASLQNARLRAGEVTILYGRALRYGNVDLAAPPAGVVHLWGADPGDSFGHSLAAGDVDADGYDDLLIGAPMASSLGNARTFAGEASLLRGGPAPLVDLDMAAPGPGVVRVWGGAPGLGQDEVGINVAIADLDGDGRGDLVLAANGADSPGFVRQNTGGVTIVLAPPAAGDLDLNASPPGVVHVWGADELDQLGGSNGNWGRALATGDFNGDGRADLAIGARFADGPGNSRDQSGEGILLYGPLVAGADLDLGAPRTPVARFWGSDAGDQMGIGLAAGDVDGDGIDDLVLGAVAGDGPGGSRADAGEALLWHGKPIDTYLARDVPVSPPPNLGEGLTVLPLQCDDCSTPVDLPFPFPFYGGIFTHLSVSSNGFVSFAPIDDPVSYFPRCFPYGADQNGIVAPLWTDLDPTAAPGTAIVRTRAQGTAPHRRFAVEWIDVPHYTESGPTPSGATFRVILYEATGAIELRYDDLDFGDPLHNGGRSAVVGVENGKGAQGLPFSCLAPDVLGAGTSRALRLEPTTPLVESRFEHQDSLWFENPVVWHLNDLCAPASHTGAFGRYAGFTNRCGDGGMLAARLALPAIPDFPEDVRLAFWSRRQVDPTFDTTTMDLSTTGPGFGTPAYYVTENSGQWRYEGIGTLFANAGDDVDLSFSYNSSAASTPLGWMVDDVQVAGCDGRVSGPGNAFAMAFGTGPSAFCEGSAPPRLDSTGSYCLDLGVPVQYQWFENAIPIPGATQPSITAPAGTPAGDYDYVVNVMCDDGTEDSSNFVSYSVEAPLGAVGDSLRVTTANNGATLVFTWDALPGATGYELRQDGVPSGAYGVVTGTTAATLQIAIPMPAGNLFFLVGGRNSCGVGALH